MGNSLYQPSFVGGELSPSLIGRTDQARYQIGLATCRNFIVQQYGGVKNRAGTKFIAPAKHANKRARLIPFAFSTEQTYVLEFGDLYLRVFKDGGQVVSGGVPVEIVTPYSEADLPLLKFTQSADVMTICHPDYAPRQLSRTSHTAWTLAAFAHVNGPFRDANYDTAKTIYASAATGSVTLTASASIFIADHVGTLIEIGQKNYGQPWEAGKSVTAGDIRRSDGKYYQAGSTATTGTLRPTHDADSWSDGAVDWLFLHPGHGVATITAVASGTSATATVLSRIPDGAVGSGGATYKWALGAWGIETGYPACSCYFQERQVFAGTPSQPQTVWMSKSGNYLDFGHSTPSADDDGVTFTIASREVNAIRHLLPMDKLVLLTSGAEWIVSGGDGVITPASVQARLQGYRGVSDRPALLVGNSALYLQDKGATVRDLGYEFASDSYTGNDLTLFSSHLTETSPIVEWAFQQVPFMTAWAVRADGVLLGMTYLREQQVAGWHRHDTDGLFESVCCVSEGSEDAVYVIVNRNGQRNVERFASRKTGAIEDAFFVDSGLTWDGAPVTTLSGLDHLNGKEVAILADGNVHPRKTVVAGAITLDYAASVIQVGLPIVADFETLDLAVQGETIRDKPKIVPAVRFLLESSRGLWAGPDAAHLTEFKQRTTEAYGQPTAPMTGLAEMRVQTAWGKGGRVFVRQSDPLPLHILAVIPEVTLGGT